MTEDLTDDQKRKVLEMMGFQIASDPLGKQWDHIKGLRVYVSDFSPLKNAEHCLLAQERLKINANYSYDYEVWVADTGPDKPHQNESGPTIAEAVTECLKRIAEEKTDAER